MFGNSQGLVAAGDADGVADPSAMPAGGEPVSGKPDGETAAPASDAAPQYPPEVEQLLTESQTAIGRLQDQFNGMRQTYDRNMQAFRQQALQREDELLDQIATRDMATMDDAGKAKYQADREAQKLTRREQGLREREDQIASREMMVGWGDFFTGRLGIPREQIVMDQGLDAFYTSAWEATEATLSDTRAENDLLKRTLESHKIPLPKVAARAATTPQGKTPPKVRTELPQTTVHKKRLADIPMGERADFFKRVAAGEIRAEDYIDIT